MSNRMLPNSILSPHNIVIDRSIQSFSGQNKSIFGAALTVASNRLGGAIHTREEKPDFSACVTQDSSRLESERNQV